jgi:hypothetical protein
MRKYDKEVYDQLAFDHPFWTNVEIANFLGVDESTVRRNLRKRGIPVFVTPELDRPIEVVGKVAVAADWHIPLMDYAYANTMVAHLEEAGYTTLAIPGDFFNMDALSRYEGKQASANFEREVHEGLVVMDSLLDTFDRVIFTKGNHDYRLARTLGFKLSFKHAISLLFGDLDKGKKERLEISNLDYLWVRPTPKARDYDSWYVCHPANYSTLPLSTARVLAGKLGTNVLTAHSHHCAKGFAANGYHVVGELGGLHDRDVTAYLQESNKFGNWNQGYATINEHNKLKLYSPFWDN